MSVASNTTGLKLKIGCDVLYYKRMGENGQYLSFLHDLLHLLWKIKTVRHNVKLYVPSTSGSIPCFHA